MRIMGVLAKKLFSFRKIVWLFLCGMLVVSGKAGAQQADRGFTVKYGSPPSLWDKGPSGRDRPPAIEPVVKYGPQRSLPGLLNGPGQKGPAGEEQGTKGSTKGKTGKDGKGEKDPLPR
jgi:hypothetical protein